MLFHRIIAGGDLVRILLIAFSMIISGLLSAEEPVEMGFQVARLNDDLFADAVMNNPELVLLLHNKDCSPCKTIHPVFVKMAEELQGEIPLFTVNTKDNYINEWMDVWVIPTVIVIKNRQIVGKRLGPMTEEELREFIFTSLDENVIHRLSPCGHTICGAWPFPPIRELKEIEDLQTLKGPGTHVVILDAEKDMMGFMQKRVAERMDVKLDKKGHFYVVRGEKSPLAEALRGQGTFSVAVVKDGQIVELFEECFHNEEQIRNLVYSFL